MRNTYLMKHGVRRLVGDVFDRFFSQVRKCGFGKRPGFGGMEAEITVGASLRLLNDCQFYAIINLGTRFLDHTFEK